MDVPTLRSTELSQPTRARLFALLGELHRPAGTDELGTAPGVAPQRVRVHLYADLGRWLVRAMSAANVGLRDVEATGRQIGLDLVAEDGAGPAEARMHGALATLGFRPTRRFPEAGRLTYRLGNCPYRDVVRERQPVVCARHRGITRGPLDTIDPKTKLVGFVPEDPDDAGCLIELRGPMARQAPEGADLEGA